MSTFVAVFLRWRRWKVYKVYWPSTKHPNPSTTTFKVILPKP